MAGALAMDMMVGKPMHSYFAPSIAILRFDQRQDNDVALFNCSQYYVT